MNEDLWHKGRQKLYEEVDKFMDKQRQYMTESPEDYKESEPADFVTWFIESF